MMYFHKTAGQFHQPLQHIQHLIFPMVDDITDNIEQATSRIYTRNIPNQLLQFTEVQSRTQGQGRHREDWPTTIEEEQ